MSDESENAPQPRETPRVDIDALRGPLARTALRVRLQRAADAGSLFLLVGLGLAGLVVALTKTAALPEADAWPYLIAAAALPALAAFGGLARRVSPLLAAKLLDRAHDLNDRVGNAVSFAAEPDRTAFMDAAIEDARQHASALKPARAMPLRAPMELAIALGLAVGVGGLAILEVPRTWEERIVHGGIVPVFVHADELEAYESHLRELLADPETDERVRAAAEDGTEGHPVIFPRRLYGELAVLTGDVGGRALLQGEDVRAVIRPGQRAICDLDTPEDWDRWRKNGA